MSTPAVAVRPPRAVKRSIQLSFMQALLGTVYLNATGNTFLIGFLLALGADNVQIGLSSAIPAMAVVMQLVAAAIVESGVSRRKIVVVSAFSNCALWGLVIAIPFVMASASAAAKVTAVIAVVTIFSCSNQILINARNSWLGELIPQRFMGSYLGRVMRYSGLINISVGLALSFSIDKLKEYGTNGFSWMFALGIVFAIAYSALFVPQKDLKTARHPRPQSLFRQVVQTFSNKPLLSVLLYGTIWMMQYMSVPFVVLYQVRDLQVSYFGITMTCIPGTIAVLICSRFWGDMIDRFGCKPIIILCTILAAPVYFIWLVVDSALDVYVFISMVNFYNALMGTGVNLALGKIIFKVTPSTGRSVQLAVYAIAVAAIAAPIQAVSGKMPEWFNDMGFHTDLRIIFYGSSIFVIMASLAAMRLKEISARPTRQLIAALPGQIRTRVGAWGRRLSPGG